MFGVEFGLGGLRFGIPALSLFVLGGGGGGECLGCLRWGVVRAAQRFFEVGGGGGGLGGVSGSEFRVLRIHDFGVEGLSGCQEYGSEPRCFLGELTRVNSGWLWELN